MLRYISTNEEQNENGNKRSARLEQRMTFLAFANVNVPALSDLTLSKFTRLCNRIDAVLLQLTRDDIHSRIRLVYPRKYVGIRHF